MPKRNKKFDGKSGGHKSKTDYIGDLTLNDFANAVGRVGRLKKASRHAIIREAKECCGAASDGMMWYDKDLDSFSASRNSGLGDEEFYHDGDLDNARSRHRKSKPQQPTNTAVTEDNGDEYPLDVWFLLSDYIRPEDIITFACICKSALQVVSTTKFWSRLYKSYYNPAVTLPERLTPECMERPHGLKTCVIRALFHVYPPFIERIRNSAPFDSERHTLTLSYCILAWHKNNRPTWDFYFKLQRSRSAPVKRMSKQSAYPDLLEMLGDMHANDDQGCRVLKITCMNFVPAPAVMGMYLSTVHLSIGSMMDHRLRLTFSSTSYGKTTRQNEEGSITIVFDPVVKIKVLQWWHPQYPYT